MKKKFVKLLSIILTATLLLPVLALSGCTNNKLSKELKALVGNYLTNNGILAATFTEEDGKVYGTYIFDSDMKEHVEVTYSSTQTDFDGSVINYTYKADGDFIQYYPNTKILYINTNTYRKQ